MKLAQVENHNPDVISCIANLSNDEVFTSPKIANAILDQLPKNVWQDPNATFLDPVSKTGIFLREITQRLNFGLKGKIPERQERINHILKKQVFGIAITELTALLSRRTLYCSKKANGKYSICTSFKKEDGNILFRNVSHKWRNRRCEWCGASESQYSRGSDYEYYAYDFIHTGNPEKIFNMKFDVIVGNPPYQLSDGGYGRSAMPIYNKFVQQAKKLNPRYLSMIIPARWYGGGKGLNEFRQEMLNDSRIRKLVDYENSQDVFPGVSVAGGICYFLWDREYEGKCEVVNHSLELGSSISELRSLNEFPTFIRHSKAVPIVRKVLEREKNFMSSQVLPYKPFGLRTYEKPDKEGDLILFWQKGEGPLRSERVTEGKSIIKKWKVVSSRSGHEHAGNPGSDGARRVLSRIEVLRPGTVCTETYLVIGAYNTKKEAENLVAYMKTRFFRFLLSLYMYSHSITKDTYAFVPILDMKKCWSDESLNRRYELSDQEIRFIISKIREMV